jgi:hypothetical protein
MSHLSQKLLNNLEQYYDQIALLFTEGVDLEDIRLRLQLSDEEMDSLVDVIFEPNPIYTANSFGKLTRYKLNSQTLKSQEVDEYGISKGY